MPFLPPVSAVHHRCRSMKTQGGCGTFPFTSPPLHQSQSALLWHSVGHLLESVRLHFHFSSPSSFPFLRWKWHSVQLGRTEALHPSSQLLTPRPPLLPDATEGHQEGLLRHDRRWRGRRYDQIRRTQFLWAHFLWGKHANSRDLQSRGKDAPPRRAARTICTHHVACLIA